MLLILKYCKALLRELILPPAGPLLLALIGLFWQRHRPRLGRALIGLGLASLWLLSTPLVADALARLAERYPPLDLHRPTGAQAIVILGGGGWRSNAPEYGAPAVQPLLLERLAYGAYLARATGLPVLVTGYHTEAVAMRASLARNFGIEPRWVEDQSFDTFDNARNSVRLLQAAGVRRILLVTHATHLWRATHEFLAAGMDVVPAPVGLSDIRDNTGPFRYIPQTQALGLSYAATYELLGEPVREFLQFTHLRRQRQASLRLCCGNGYS